MLCCVGLIGGVAVGQSLGGYWTVAAPAIGFGLGFYGDMKFMHGMHGKRGKNPTDSRPESNPPFKEEKTEAPLLPESILDTKPPGGEGG
jgi:hypothetical protein